MRACLHAITSFYVHASSSCSTHFLQALVSLLATVYTSGDSEAEISEKDACLVLQPMLLECLQDYTTDKRGDVGSQCVLFCCHSPISLLSLFKVH